MEPRAEAGGALRAEDDPRVISAKLVNAIYRLIKACQIHAENNNAVAQVVDFVVASATEYCDRAKVASAAILFTPNAVFVNRQMLRASRETYQLALELGQMLEPCGVTEITLSSSTTIQEVAEFGRTVADFTRLGTQSPRFAEGGWEGIKLRKVQGLTFSTNLSPPVKAARTYAAALLIVRTFYEELKKGKYELRQGIKRVAQKLVSQNESGGRLLLSVAAAPAADADRAGLALSSAILALAMATQLTDDRTLLSSLASAALLYDAGRQRLVGYETEEGMRVQRQLNAQEEELLPTSSIVALSALGKFHPPNLTRAVIVSEALSLRDGGLPYGGRRPPSLMARILATARAFSELRVPRGTTPALSIDDTLQVLEGQARDSTDRTLLKLLIGALGIFPAGTMVELSTGEMGVVLSTPVLPVDFARPPVRVMYDANAQLLEQPIDVDLAAPPSVGEPPRYVRRPIDTTDQQMKQMRAYVVQLAASRARKNSVAKMRAVMAKGDAPSSSTGAPSSSASVPSWGSTGSSAGYSNPSAQSSLSQGAPSSGPRSSAELSPASPRVEPARDSRSLASARPATRSFDGRGHTGPAPAPSPHGIAVPSPDGSKPRPASTRALGWEEYGRELASSSASSAAADDLNDTDALLAAYLSEEAPEPSPLSPPSAPDPISSSGPHLRPPLSAQGAQPVSSSGMDVGEARSFGLRWSGDRASNQGSSQTPTSRPTGGGFHSPGRATTGSGRASAEPPSSGGHSVDRVSSGFGGLNRATNSAGLRLGRDPKSAQGAAEPESAGSSTGGGARPIQGRTKLGTGSSADHSWSPPTNERAHAAPDDEGFSFEERPFDAPVASTGRRAPLRGSLSSAANRAVDAAAMASSRTAPTKPAIPAVSQPAASQPTPAPAPERAPPEEPPPTSLPVSKRAKAGSMNWGAPRRNDKK